MNQSLETNLQQTKLAPYSFSFCFCWRFVTTCGGVIALLYSSFGAALEYNISMIFTESKNRPICLIDKIYDKFEGGNEL